MPDGSPARATMISPPNSTSTSQSPPLLNTPGGPTGPAMPGGVAKSPSNYATPLTSPSQHPTPGSPRHQSGTIDLEGMLRAHGGDLKRTLDAAVSERNSLQAQNTQLWRLVEKLRTQCAQLASDNDRLRADRERANTRLVSAGMEPVTSNRAGASGGRVPNSSSSATLAVRGEQAIEPRRHHDFDDKASLHSGPTPFPRQHIDGADSQSFSSPSFSSLAPSALPPPSDSAPAGLLPSPMPERALRHESRMVFPPEVASMLALADSSPAKDHTREPSSSANQTPSSGSSKPSSGGTNFQSSPLAAGLGLGSDAASGVGASPRIGSATNSGRATPIIEATEENRPAEELIDAPSEPRPSQDTIMSSRPSTSNLPVDRRPSTDSTTAVHTSSAANAPDHTFLSGALLPHTRLSIPHSTIFPNQHGRDVLCFIVQVNVKASSHPQPLSWTVGKTFSAFLELDQRAQDRSSKSRKDWKRMVSPLPEGRAWKDFAPSKIDQRKVVLEQYLESMLVAPISDKTDLVNFLTTDIVQAKVNANRKEGYLTKKGKTLGGWKTRYFVLEGPVMKYYETRGGAQLGSIQIAYAQIGRQNRANDSTEDRNHRHAFLIIEAGRKDGSSSRHVLCASSDVERDSWIEMLVRQVDPQAAGATSNGSSNNANSNANNSANASSASASGAASQSSGTSASQGHARRRSAIQPRKGSKDVIVTSAQPMSSMLDPNGKFMSGAPLPSVINHMESQRQLHASAPGTNATAMTSTASSGSGPSQTTQTLSPSTSMTSTMDATPTPAAVTTSEPTPKPTRRTSAMPGRSSFSPAYLTKLSSDGHSSVPGFNMDRDRDRKAKSGRFWGFGKSPEKPSRPVFGVPLADSIAIASVAGLPAIVFRCIEYLEAKKADQEEGIYRLSGSSAVIKGLKDRFNTEGDVNLLALDERWDPHAVAGLLKTYLRELPTSLLTPALHIRFLAVMDLIDPAERVAELSRLVAELPSENYALLRAFTAHLILIVRNSSVNKMTLRNIGIVFSPTLGIPAGIFYELVSRFGAIFDDDASGDNLPLDDTAAAAAAAAPPEGNGSLRATAGSPVGNEAQPSVSNLEVMSNVGSAMNKRNSRLYQAAGADAMLGLAGRALDPANDDTISDLSGDDLESDAAASIRSSEVSVSASVSPGNSDTNGSNATPTATRRQTMQPAAAAAASAQLQQHAAPLGRLYAGQGDDVEALVPAR